MEKTKRPTFQVQKQAMNKIVAAMLGREYKFGGNGETIGNPFDCFGMLVEYQKLKFGADLLSLHKGFDYPFFSYQRMADHKHLLMLSTFKEYLDRCFVKINLGYILPGDILWAKADEKETSGIYLGGQKMMVTAPVINCTTIPTEYYEIKDAYRWLLSFQ
jgi:hypothetical protein